MTDHEKEFRDPIHGFIQVNKHEQKIIDHPIFQRLRHIKQLSLGHYAYHGAEHSRFGHALGAMYLAGRAFDAIKKNSNEISVKLNIDEIDRQTLRFASLLHDVGHTPFSHSLGDMVSDEHEDYSTELVEHAFSGIIQDAHVDLKAVKDLIKGDPIPDKPFLSHIVNGQLDVDRLDYLLRDSYYAGVTYGHFDLDRLIDQLCIVDNHFVVLEGGYHAVEQMIFARYQMYQQVYFHKTKRSFELMLWKCYDLLKKNGKIDYPTLEELKNIDGQTRFSTYDDQWFLNKIYSSEIPEVKTISKMIRERMPYLVTYSPLIYRKKLPKVIQNPSTSVDEGLYLIQSNLQNNLASLGIKDHEFLTDEASRAPYSLMPNYATADEPEPEGDSISIYYKNNQYIEAIEKRSTTIFELAKNQPTAIRGFIIPEKYNVIKKYLFETFQLSIPERNS